MQGIKTGGLPGVYDPARAHNIQAFVPGPNDYFALPAGISKSQAIATICAALRLQGATEREIAVWRHIADTTERAAWSATDRAPLNWRRQSDMAREMGLGERQWRNIEHSLVRFGVLAIATAENGYRGYRSGSTLRAPLRSGLSLEPALANYEAFVGRLAEAEQIEALRQEHILHTRTARHRIGLLIAGIADREVHHWALTTLAALERDLRPEVLRSAPAPALQAWHAALLDFEDRLRDALLPLACSASRQDMETTAQTDTDRQVVDNTENKHNISAAAEMGFRCHIQPEYNLIESCNDPNGSSLRTPACADDTNSVKLPPHGVNNCIEKNNAGFVAGVNPDIQHNLESLNFETSNTAFEAANSSGEAVVLDSIQPKCALLAKLTPERIRALASDDAATYLDAFQDWREAIPFILRELGINISAWLDAVEVMGEPIAFLALIVIDRNRFHPVVPVRSPGGALRAFTRKAQSGELNLTRAIIGIWERERQGKQPKSAERPERIQ